MRTIQIATLPNRVDLLEKTVESLYNQVDTINIMLNGHEKVPECCKKPKINTVILDNSTGDAAKFYGIERLKGLVFTCDDDLIYPKEYINHLENKLKEYKYKHILSCHGRTMNKKPVKSYHRDRKEAFRCLYDVNQDSFVDVAGTGCMAFHTDTVKVRYTDFQHPNMADIWMAKVCYEQQVKQLVIKHKEGWIKYMEPPNTIFDERFWDGGIETEIYNSY